jgi:hypothetical protein
VRIIPKERLARPDSSGFPVINDDGLAGDDP